MTLDTVDQSTLKIARMTVSGKEGRISTLAIHYLVGQAETVRSFTERHRLGLFTDTEYRAAYATASLTVTYDPVGLLGRGLYLGTPRP